MSEIDWSKAPEGYPIWIEDLKPGMCSDMGGWHREESDRYVNDKGAFWSKPEDGFYRVHRRPTESPAWTGTGLPSVGTVCEYYIDDGKWRQCEVVAHKDGYAVIWITAAHVFSSRSCGLLRPLRTPEQIEAEEREKAVRELSAIISSKIIDRSAAVAIYEAGYRKQGEGK